MSITNYLPENNESSATVAKVFKSYEGITYAIGSGARKALYGLKTPVNNYNFVVSTNSNTVGPLLADELRGADGDKVVTHDEVNDIITASYPTFALTVRIQPVDAFLRQVRFAGDGLAVYVPDGRPIVLPEYMSLPPLVQVAKVEKGEAQDDELYLKGHVESLTRFQEEMTAIVQASLAAPTEAKPITADAASV